MQIPVNKDIDDYKDDFFKGMTLRQTTMCVLTLAVGIGCYFLCNSVLGLPQTVSLYLVFPVALPFAAAGFLKIDGMPPIEYLKRRREVTQTPLYRYRPMVFERAESGKGDWMENFMTDGECLGQEQQDITYPFCQRMHSDDRYRVLFTDDSITDKLLHTLGNYGKEDFISYLKSHSHLNFQEAEAIYTFQINGCLAINRLMLYNKCSDWQTIQKTVDAFLKAGLEHFLLL